MSKIIPFEALLPNQRFAGRIISPPYDVVTTDEARLLAKDNPYSFLHIIKPEIDLPPDTDPYSNAVYEKGAENFSNFQKEGWLIKNESSFYIYRLVSGAHTQTGIVCGASADEYGRGLIKKHELTREAKVADRVRLAERTGTHLEPVFLVHRSSRAVASFLEEETKSAPLYDLTDKDSVRHVLWEIKRKGEIGRILSKIPALYIADGHHRSEAAFRLKDKSHYFPAVVFSEEDVVVYEYHFNGEKEKRPLSRYTIKDIMECADKKEIMPPKSTWFAPKLASGLFVYKFSAK